MDPSCRRVTTSRPSGWCLQEKRLIGKYFDEISQDTGKYVFGVDDTLKALEMGAVETLIVWENLDVNRYTLKVRRGWWEWKRGRRMGTCVACGTDLPGVCSLMGGCCGDLHYGRFWELPVRLVGEGREEGGR